ncbi:MAG: hypothetical protein LW832_01775 [Parachlamydia sp.]|jgi:hypothetical protein|nr:hypothetical protein [Parachlamydia sp.]
MQKIKQLFLSFLLISLAASPSLFSQVQEGYVVDCTGCPPQPCYFKGFLIADLLYWRAYESKLDVCRPELENPCGECRTYKGEGREPHFKWGPGFRIGLGYLINDFDFLITLTHFNSRTNHSEHDRLNWKVDFDSIDLLTGYEFGCTPCLAIRPFGGLRFARIDQEIRTSKCRQSLASNFGWRWKHDEDFSGIGPVLGLDGNWNLYGINLYVNVAVSWLYGNFHVHLNQSEQQFDETYCVMTKTHLTACIPVFDASAGIRWQACLCRGIQFVFQLGLEHHAYFNYNRIGDCGDLNFDGLNLSAGFAF